MINHAAQCLDFLSTQAALSMSGPRLQRLQSRRIRTLVRDACRHIPWYAERMRSLGLNPADVCSLDDLHHLPIIRKSDLQAADPESLLNSRYRRPSLYREQTSGSSGRPFVMHFDIGYRRRRKALFLRALMDCGYRPGQRLMIVTSREKTGMPAWMGWRYLSHEDDAQTNLDRYNAARPHILYGWVTPIRRMAEAALERSEPAHIPHAVITTAETLDGPTRELLQRAFTTPVYEIYGLTETGTIAWQSPRTAHYRISHESLIVELLPTDDADDACRVVVTNLALRSMPFIRYETGDLAQPGPPDRRHGLATIQRVEGRQVDCIRLNDGRVVSPFELTTAMEEVPGIWRYQILQEAFDRLTVRYQPQSHNCTPPESTKASTQRVMQSILGQRVQVDVSPETSLDPPPGRKFRVVQSNLKNPL